MYSQESKITTQPTHTYVTTIDILKSRTNLNIMVLLIHKVFTHPEIYEISFNVAIMAFKEIM